MKRFPRLLCLLFVFSSCSMIDRESSVQDVFDGFNRDFFMELYYDHLQHRGTKGNEADSPLFSFEYGEVDWDHSHTFRDDMLLVADIDVTQKKEKLLILHDGMGRYISECVTNIRVVKSLSTGKASMYYHIVIPDRESMSTHLFHEGGVEHLHFGGFEIFALLDGTVVGMNKYEEGRLYSKLFVGNGENDIKSIRYWLNYLIKDYFEVSKELGTKTSTPEYLCPRCSELLGFFPEIGYFCWECGWNELTGLDGELDPSIIIAIGGGNSDGDDWVNPTDPSQGGGLEGGGHVGGGNNEGSQTSGIDLLFGWDSMSEELIVPAMEELYRDCAGRSLINAVSDMGISFVQNNTQLQMMRFVITRTGSHETYSIQYNLSTVSSTLILMEELIHAIQVKNHQYDHSRFLNIEIEAKMGVYVYCRNNGLCTQLPGGYHYWNTTYGRLLETPSQYNYERTIDFTRDSLGYDDEIAFPENTQSRGFQSVAPLFSPCGESYSSYSQKVEDLFEAFL